MYLQYKNLLPEIFTDYFTLQTGQKFKITTNKMNILQ